MLDIPLPLDVFFALSVEKYYKERDDSISRDFITAPEISQMFCHAVAVWLYNQIINIKEDISLIEIGGGNGTLMREILQFFSREYTFKNIYFVETSKKMIDRQRRAMSNYENCYWVDSIDKLPSNLKSIVIANEFFDALPIKQFVKVEGGFREIYISKAIDLVQSQDIISDIEMKKIFQYSNVDIGSLKSGDILELSTASLTILDKICQTCHGALIIDYGYYTPTKKNTIKAIVNHTILDSFLVTPGTADISAEVDFGSMENFVRINHPNFNLQCTTQDLFLKNNHIDVISNKARSEAKTENEVNMVDHELNKILIDMGKKFKALSICKKTSY